MTCAFIDPLQVHAKVANLTQQIVAHNVSTLYQSFFVFAFASFGRKRSQNAAQSIMSSRRRIGIAICGFGRAGQIHLDGVRRNCRCQLLYVVDRVEEDKGIKQRIEQKLEQHLMEGVKVVGLESYENVSSTIKGSAATAGEHLLSSLALALLGRLLPGAWP